MAKNTSSSEFLFDPMNDASFKSLVSPKKLESLWLGFLRI